MRYALIFAVADLPGDLPLVLGGCDEVVEEHRDHEIVDHGRVIVARDGFAAGVEDGAPDENHAHERDDAEDGSEEKIPAIDKGILEADVEELPVF